MSRDYLENLLKDMYKAESDRADKLDGDVNLPTAILTVLLGVGALYIEKAPSPSWGIRVVLYYLSSAIYLGFLIGALFCLVRSYTHQRYRMIANPKEMTDFEAGMRKHYEAVPQEGKSVDDEVKRELQDALIEQYTESSEQNRQRNLQRTKWLFMTTQFIVGSLAMMIVSRILFYTVNNTTPRPQEVKIISMPDIPSMGVKSPGTQEVQLNPVPGVHVGALPRIEGMRDTATRKVEIAGPSTLQKVEIVKPNP